MSTPRTFKDGKNRTWIIKVTLDAITLVLARVGLDLRLLRDDHDKIAVELDDPNKMKQVVAVLTETERAAVNVTIDDVFQSITTEEQMHEMVVSVYQATFDFFQSRGEVLNDALGKAMRAMESASRNTTQRMRSHLDSGKMDKFLSIVMDPEQAMAYIQASLEPETNPGLAAAWKEVADAELPEAKRLPAFIRLAVERNLEPAPAATPAPKMPTSNTSTSSPNAGDSQASAESTQGHSVGEN